MDNHLNIVRQMLTISKGQIYFFQLQNSIFGNIDEKWESTLESKLIWIGIEQLKEKRCELSVIECKLP